MEVYLSENAFVGLLVSTVEVYRRECFGHPAGAPRARSDHGGFRRPLPVGRPEVPGSPHGLAPRAAGGRGRAGHLPMGAGGRLSFPPDVDGPEEGHHQAVPHRPRGLSRRRHVDHRRHQLRAPSAAVGERQGWPHLGQHQRLLDPPGRLPQERGNGIARPPDLPVRGRLHGQDQGPHLGRGATGVRTSQPLTLRVEATHGPTRSSR